MRCVESPGDARQNALLAALSDTEWERMSRDLKPAFLPLGERVYESGIRLDNVYFPTTAVVSLECPMVDGSSIETAIVGREGLVGIALFLGGDSRPNDAVALKEGWAYRLNRRCFQAEVTRGGSMLRLLLRYTQALLTLTAQTALCNRHHRIDQQLCRWLLLNLDRSASSELTATHEQIATLLGVRREGVTDAVGRLVKSGLLHSSRGRIAVVDRAGLEARSCECYGVVRREFDRLLPNWNAILDPGTGSLQMPAAGPGIQRGASQPLLAMYGDAPKLPAPAPILFKCQVQPSGA